MGKFQNDANSDIFSHNKEEDIPLSGNLKVDLLYKIRTSLPTDSKPTFYVWKRRNKDNGFDIQLTGYATKHHELDGSPFFIGDIIIPESERNIALGTIREVTESVGGRLDFIDDKEFAQKFLKENALVDASIEKIKTLLQFFNTESQNRFVPKNLFAKNWNELTMEVEKVILSNHEYKIKTLFNDRFPESTKAFLASIVHQTGYRAFVSFSDGRPLQMIVPFAIPFLVVLKEGDVGKVINQVLTNTVGLLTNGKDLRMATGLIQSTIVIAETLRVGNSGDWDSCYRTRQFLSSIIDFVLHEKDFEDSYYARRGDVISLKNANETKYFCVFALLGAASMEVTSKEEDKLFETDLSAEFREKLAKTISQDIDEMVGYKANVLILHDTVVEVHQVPDFFSLVRENV